MNEPPPSAVDRCPVCEQPIALGWGGCELEEHKCACGAVLEVEVEDYFCDNESSWVTYRFTKKGG